MSKESFDYSDLDAILAEFRGASEPSAPAEEPVLSKPEYSPEPPAPPIAEERAPEIPEEPAFELPPLYTREEEEQRRADAEKTKLLQTPSKDFLKSAESEAPKKAAKPFKPAKAEKPAKAPKKEKPAREEKPPRVYTQKRIPGILRFLMALVFAVFTLAEVAWGFFNLHPASGTLSFSGYDTKLRLSEKLDVYVNNAASDALGELAYIKKIYTLQESDTVSPAPNPDGFGTTYDPADLQAVIDRAAILLDGQKVTFDPTADFVPDEPIRWYLDDTILVIAWKEYIQERCCTFAEVKVAHGSQLRRKLAEDSYSSSVQLYASDMANASNAVVAINGDFYAFRDLGITVYQRKLYRNNPAQVDSCFFTASGEMLFTRAGELMGEGEAQRFIDDNDVVFAVAFGPVLVDNGELQYCSGYPIGEINTEYSRSCIAMTDDLHYLLMTINHTMDARPRATINELARFIYSKGVQKAYTLDGGQTAEIIMMGGPINHVDFGYERIVSDIIYFATAIPEEVRS